MTCLRLSIDSFSPIRLPIGAQLTVILASLWPPDSDGVAAPLHPFVISFLYPPSPVVAAILSSLSPLGLRETEDRPDDRAGHRQ
jgi:hypothetical protein